MCSRAKARNVLFRFLPNPTHASRLRLLPQARVRNLSRLVAHFFQQVFVLPPWSPRTFALFSPLTLLRPTLVSGGSSLLSWSGLVHGEFWDSSILGSRREADASVLHMCLPGLVADILPLASDGFWRPGSQPVKSLMDPRFYLKIAPFLEPGVHAYMLWFHFKTEKQYFFFPENLYQLDRYRRSIFSWAGLPKQWLTSEGRQSWGEVPSLCLIVTIKIWNQYFTLENGVYKMYCSVWIYPQLIFYRNKAQLKKQFELSLVSLYLWILSVQGFLSICPNSYRREHF